MAASLVLALDTSSPEISIAVAREGTLQALRTTAQRQASSELLRLVDEALREAGSALSELTGAVALRGPGSFTGLRVGLSTVLGFHQALGLAATALPTLEVLAASVPGGPRTLALVHALRREWYGQIFVGHPPRPQGGPRRLEVPQHIAASAPERCVGYGLEALAAEPESVGLPLLAPGQPLAAIAALHASLEPPLWDATLLTTPLYLSPPPATPPGAPKPVLGHGPRP